MSAGSSLDIQASENVFEYHIPILLFLSVILLY